MNTLLNYPGAKWGMAKAKMYGTRTAYILNSKADMRFKKKIYQRGRENTCRPRCDVQRRKEVPDGQ